MKIKTSQQRLPARAASPGPAAAPRAPLGVPRCPQTPGSPSQHLPCPRDLLQLLGIPGSIPREAAPLLLSSLSLSFQLLLLFSHPRPPGALQEPPDPEPSFNKAAETHPCVSWLLLGFASQKTIGPGGETGLKMEEFTPKGSSAPGDAPAPPGWMLEDENEINGTKRRD